MTEITNYKVKEFLKQPTDLILEYVDVLKHLKPIETNLEVYNLSLKNVEFIKENITNSDDISILEIIAIVQDYKEIIVPKWLIKLLPNVVNKYIQQSHLRKVLNIKITEFFGLINNIKNQLEVISKAESSSLVSENTNVKWEQVNGSEKLKIFGVFNTLDSLAGGDILKWNQINELPYGEVFTKLLMNKINADLQMEMQNIKTTKI